MFDALLIISQYTKLMQVPTNMILNAIMCHLMFSQKNKLHYILCAKVYLLIKAQIT